MEDFKVGLDAELDTSKIEQQINDLGGKKVKLDVDTGTTAKDISKVDKQITTTAKSATGLGDSLKKSLNIGSAAAVTVKAIQSIKSAMDEALEAVTNIDAAITNLRMATGSTYDEVYALVQTYNQLGQAMGATTTEVTNSADAWLRQGNSISETNELIRDSMILSKVAGMDSADATTYLTSAAKGYKVAAEDVINIVDKISSVDLVSATDASGLAEAMSSVAVTANNAGIEMDQLLGYLAAVGEVKQKSMSSIGESFKTVFTRMTNVKLGKVDFTNEDGAVESLSDVEMVLNDLGIQLRESNNEFRDLDDVLDEVAASWDNYSTVQQAAISKAFAGTRQSENFRVLMANYSTAVEYANVAANSAGTAEQKFEAYLDSIEAKTKSLQASFESLSLDIISPESVGNVIEATTAIVTFLDKTNLLKGSLAGLAGMGAIKAFTVLASGISSASAKMSEFNAALNLVKSGNIGEAQLQQLIQLTGNLSQSQLKAVLSSKNLSNEQRITILTSQGLSKAEAQASLSAMGLSAAEGTAAKTTVSLSGALKGLWATIKANPLVLVGTAITAVATAYSNYKQAAEEAAQQAEENQAQLIEAATAATKTASSMQSLIEQYKALADASDGTWPTEQATEVESIQQQITDLVGEQASNLDLVNGKIDEEYQKLLNIYGVLSKEELDSAESAYLASKQELEQGYQRETNIWGQSKEDDYDASWYITRAYAHKNNVSQADAQKWWGSQAGLDTQWTGDIPAALDKIGSYEDGLERLYEWRSLLNDATSDGFSDSSGEAYDTADALTYLNSKITEFEDKIQAANEAKDNFFSAKANNEVLDYLVNNDIDTQEQFNNWIDSVLGDSTISSDYAQALITAMQAYFPAFEIPDDVKKSFIADIDSLVNDVTSYIPDADGTALGQWFTDMSVSEFETFVNWWKSNAGSDVVTGSLNDMMGAFADYMERISIAANGVSNDVATITSNAELKLADTQSLISELSAVQDVLDSQSTGASLSLDDYNAEELKDYTSALEYNNGTLQLNAEKVNELVRAKADEQIAINNTNKAIAQSKYLDNVAEIERLRRELKQYGNTENSATDSINNQINALITENDTLRSTCTQYDLMTSSLQEATSAYQHWINAQSAAESGDMFDDTVDALNHIYDTLNEEDSEFFGRVGREDYQAAVDLIIPDTVDAEDTEAVNSYLDSIYKLFTFDDDGNYAGLNIQNFCEKAVEAGLMTLNEAGDSYKIVGEKTIEDFANGMNLALPLVQAMFGEMEEYGAEFTWADEANKTIGDLAVSADVATQKLRELNPDLTLELDVSYLETAEEKVSALDDTIAQMQELKIDADATEVEYANSVISYCIAQKQQLEEPAIMDVDVSKLSESAAEAVTMMQEFQTAYNNLELKKALGVDTTEAQAEVDALFAEISSSDNDYLVSLGLDTTSVETLNTEISNLETPEILATFNIDETALLSYEPEGKTATVTYDIDTTKVDAYDPDDLKRTVTYYVKTVGSVSNQSVNGTAHVTGTAYAGGNWGNAPGGKTLVGELGQEIVVDPHTGRWYTVGDTGAEFRDIPRGAIVFNHKQSESLLKNGYVAGRASALAGGTAMLGGGISVSSASNSTVSGGYRTSNYKKASTSATSSTSTNSSTSTSTAEEAEETLEKLDWIEIALEQIDDAIKEIQNTATSAYKSLSSKLSASKDELGLITEEIDLQQKAYDRYMQEANSVGLDAGLAELVQTGAIDIEEYDEETRELISNYQEWHEKALACSDAIDELHESLAELYLDNFNNTKDDFENRMELLEHTYAESEAKLNKYKSSALAIESQYYEDLQDIQSQQIDLLNEELTALESSFSKAMSSGEIEEYSETWYEMKSAINAVEEEVTELHESLAELYSDNFDTIQSNFDSRLSQYEHLANSYNADIDMLEAKGYLVATTYYEGLKDVERQRIAMLKDELSSLKKSFADAMESGEIEEGSEAWYDMRAAIDEVEEAIDDANLSLQEYIQTIRQIKWDNFDYGLERISHLAAEADFLVDLLSSKDLFDDNGNLTDEGLATMGLYGQNYNTYMAQADEYAKEILDIQDQLVNDPANSELLERYEELQEAQWDCVLVAEDQKQAMIDLVEEGINAQIDAMSELIDSYVDALDSAKDLYSYQKSLSEQTKNIADIEKQLAAYEGDDSEENKARIQKLKVSLEEAEQDLQESEYEHYISEQKKLLDNLETEYAEILTSTLDDTDELIRNVISEVNSSAGDIGGTINSAAEEVGVALSQNMQSVWNSTDSLNGVLSTYNAGFTEQLTSINSVLTNILGVVESMVSLSGTDLAISELASKGVINTPAYWQNAVSDGELKYLDELLVKLSENASDEQINNFSDANSAIKYLGDNGVINTPEYWYNNVDQLDWLGELLIKAANHTLPKYATGGLVTATGLAQLDGTANDPELVLNAQDTENFLALKDTLQSLQHQELTKVPSYPEFASFIGSELCDGLLRIAKEGSLTEPVFEGVPLSDKILKLIELESEHAATMNKLVEDIASIANIAEQTNTIGATSTFGDINIAIDHVEDYNDFVTQLQHDKEFERMFSDMLNSATGMGSSFAKYKRSWN